MNFDDLSGAKIKLKQNLTCQAQKFRLIRKTWPKNHRISIPRETPSSQNISVTDFNAFDRLQTPIWIYDIDNLQMWWANKAALHLWNVQSREELLNYDFGNVSESTQIQLQSYLNQFKQGKIIAENWTFYPQGQPVSLRCLCSGVQIEPGRMVMLVEGTTEVVNQIDQEILRAIEALRHTTVMISLYRIDGVPLIQNPAAIECYGDTLHPNSSMDNAFLRHFVDSHVGTQAMETIQLGEVFSIETQVLTTKGMRWHEIDIRCSHDPVTGNTMILVNEKDITEQQTALEERQRAEQALKQQTEREQMVSAIAQHIYQSLDLDEILNTTVTEVRNFLQTDRVIIYRFNPDGAGVVITESVTETCQAILNMESTDKYFVETPLKFEQEGIVKAIPDIYTAGFSNCYVEFLAKLQVRAKLIVPILHGNSLWGLLVAHDCSHPRRWYPWEAELLQQLATQLAIAIQQSELYQKLQLANQQLENLAMVDQLTQIANRRCFDHKLDFTWQHLLREQGFLSLLLCDIDYFKLYNDTYGHPAGDTCLTLVAQAFQQTIKRSTDLAARYGGEEFVVILPNTDSDGAVQIAQEIQEAIQKLNIPHIASAVKPFVTLSIGIATVIPMVDLIPLDLIEAADQALYQAKTQGRNRTFVSHLLYKN